MRVAGGPRKTYWRPESQVGCACLWVWLCAEVWQAPFQASSGGGRGWVDGTWLTWATYSQSQNQRARQLYRGYLSEGTKLDQAWVDFWGQQLPPGWDGARAQLPRASQIHPQACGISLTDGRNRVHLWLLASPPQSLVVTEPP